MKIKLFLSIALVTFLFLPSYTLEAQQSTSESSSRYPDEDSDVDESGNPAPDGLTNEEEAEANTDPKNPDTDEDDTIDSLDGWAGGRDKDLEKLFAPPRLAVTRYGIIDLGEGYEPLFVNNKTQVVLRKAVPETSPIEYRYYFWDKGEMTDLPENVGAIGGINNEGQVAGTLKGVLTLDEEEVEELPEDFGKDGYFLGKTAKWQNKAFIWKKGAEPALTELEDLELTEDLERSEEPIQEEADIYNYDYVSVLGISDDGKVIASEYEKFEQYWGNTEPEEAGTFLGDYWVYWKHGNFEQSSILSTGHPEALGKPHFDWYHDDTTANGKSDDDDAPFYQVLQTTADGNILSNLSYYSMAPEADADFFYGDIGQSLRKGGSWRTLTRTEEENWGMLYNRVTTMNNDTEMFGETSGGHAFRFSYDDYTERESKIIFSIDHLNTRLQALNGGLIWQNHRFYDLNDLVDREDWAVTSSSGISDKGLIISTAKKLRNADEVILPSVQKLHGCLLIPTELAVDANRDGIINFSGSKIIGDPTTYGKARDKTTREMPFSFWLNDDFDQEKEDKVGSETKDSDDDVISQLRDLEDFTRLHLYIGSLHDEIRSGNIKVGLEWKDTGGTSPAVKIYRAADSVGWERHLSNDNGDGTGSNYYPLQQTSSYNVSLGTIDNSGGFKFSTDFWNSTGTGIPTFDESHPTRYLIFEGVSEGKGKLVLTFWKGNQKIGEGGGTWLDLKNIKRMYVRSKGTPGEDIAHPWDSATIETNYTDDPNSFEYEQPADEEEKALIFVHGIHSPFVGVADSYLQNISVAETVFKRLWHTGFKGRFAFYKWPALNPANFEYTSVSNIIDFDFNESEWRAYQYARGLSKFVESQPASYQRHIFAHSQGNSLVGSAFRNFNLAARTWIITQGAIPMSCYDSDTKHSTVTIPFTTPDTPDEGGYRGWLSEKVPARVVNFSNDLDSVTGIIWDLNQGYLKPNSADAGLITIKYHYSPGDRWVGKHIGTTPAYWSRSVTELSESLALIAHSKSKSIAHAPDDIGGEVDEYVDMPTEFGFGDSHSSQWEYGMQSGVWRYYKKLLNEIE